MLKEPGYYPILSMAYPLSLSVIVPVYNERRTIREIVRRIQETPRPIQIIVVDDFSTDGTRNILRTSIEPLPNVDVLYHSRNQGKGSAIRTGLSRATNDVVIVQDADLEYDPSEYEVLLRPIESGKADVVYGSRFQHGERRVLYFWHSVGNRALTTLSNMFTDLNLTDMETGHKAFKRKIIQNIVLESDRFGFEPEITAKIARSGCSIYEVPINYYGRSYSEGKKITWRDGVAALLHIVRFSYSKKPFIRNPEEFRQSLVSPPPVEDVGVDTLEAFEQARRYNSWICERFLPYVGKSVLEIGSGIGNIASELLAKPGVESYVGSDLAPDSLQVAQDRLGHDPRFSSQVWNAGCPPPEDLRNRRFDTIVCSNVLEHIEDHLTALKQMCSLLQPGGRLILLVPAQQNIYCDLDKDLGHHRRYDPASLYTVLTSAGFQVEETFQHNFVGALGWWWSGRVRGRRRVRAMDMVRFDRLVPFLKPIDRFLVRLFFGVSLIAVARPAGAVAGAKPGESETVATLVA